MVTSGGGVAVTQSVSSPLGLVPGAVPEHGIDRTGTSPAGTTAAADALYLSLLNPTSTPVVVDLSFVTPNGWCIPSTTRASSWPAGQVAAENVSAEVQQVSNFSTVVTARTGRVVASEIQDIVGPAGSGGLSLVPGCAAPQSHWAIPQAQEAPGASSQVDVFNPGSTTETVHGAGSGCRRARWPR